MNRNAIVKRVVVGAGFLFLCAAPRLGLAQSDPSAAAPPSRTRSASAQPGNHTSPPDLLAGLRLTDDQKAKISQIREDVKSRLAAVAIDNTLSPEVKDAMLGGFQRIENSQILAVLTPEQQREVRRQMSAWRAARGQSKYGYRQVPVRNSQAK